jgi:hypothetical protein
MRLLLVLADDSALAKDYQRKIKKSRDVMLEKNVPFRYDLNKLWAYSRAH